MTYVTQATVLGLIPQVVVDATSKPTTAQATTMQQGIYDVLNTHLAAAGVPIPVTSDGSDEGAAFLAFVGRLECYGTAADILKAKFPGHTGPDQEAAWKFWQDKWDAGIAGLMDGSLIPPVVGATGGTAVPASYPTRNPDTEVDDGVIGTPRFRMTDAGPYSTRF